MWMTVNFLVCVLCLQALVVPPSVELSALFLTSGVRWWGGSHTGMITPIDHGRIREDIKGVCHTNAPHAHVFCFSFMCLFMWGKSAEHARHSGSAMLLQSHRWVIRTWELPITASVGGSVVCSGVHQSYRWELVTHNHCLHFSSG